MSHARDCLIAVAVCFLAFRLYQDVQQCLVHEAFVANTFKYSLVRFALYLVSGGLLSVLETLQTYLLTSILRDMAYKSTTLSTM